MNRLKVAWVAGIISLSIAGAALAHGVNLNATIHARAADGSTTSYTIENLPTDAQINSIEIIATYSTGEPMAGARVQVFAPDDRSMPWTTGTSNTQGRFTFTPDLSKRGRWVVRVQEADHSNIIDIPIR